MQANNYRQNICQKKSIIAAILVFIVLVAVSIFYRPPSIQAESGNKFLPPYSFSRLAEKISPAVVNIRTVKTLTGGSPVLRHFFQHPWERNEPFNNFFERFFGEGFQREFKHRSLGSGFIVDKDGYIVTNNHVIQDADEISVKLNNGEEFDAEIVGRDPNTDLALIKIKAEDDLPVADLGDSDDLKVGQWVLAIGSPFGLEHTVTAGIVSAKGRVIGSGPYNDLIQTDASINPGNSGGPLINMHGEVVGINTAIIAGGQGIGFAVPVNIAKTVLEQLKEDGEVTRGWLGVGIQDITEEMSDYQDIKDKRGVLVAEVFKGDPAEKAGIKPGDIILEVDGEKVGSSRDLTRRIAGIPVGKTIKIKALRNGRKKTFKVKITKRDDTALASSGRPMRKADELGLYISMLTPEIARRFNMEETEGVIILRVEPGSKASKAGLRSGDLIKEINHQVIENVKDYREAIEKVKSGKSVQLFIRRINAGFLVVKLTK